MLEIMMLVMDELARRGVTVATLEYPGFIKIDRPEERGALTFGTANHTWGADVWSDCEMTECVEYIESTLTSNSTDVRAIADFVVFVAMCAGVPFIGGEVPFVEVKHHA